MARRPPGALLAFNAERSPRRHALNVGRVRSGRFELFDTDLHDRRLPCRHPLADDRLAQMRIGKQMNISYQSTDKHDVSVGLLLTGFAVA